MAESESRFVNFFDAHHGFERVGGHLKPLHDQRAIEAALRFAHDFKPHVLTYGGDMADCGTVSHWNANNPRRLEGMRVKRDAERFRAEVLVPGERAVAKGGKLYYLIGNHEQWLVDYVDQNPQLEDLVDVDALFELSAHGWSIIPQGGAVKLGKLYIVHGDHIKGSAYVAKRAVELYQRNIHFGHHHTYQLHTNIAPLDDKPKQGVAVPSLCMRNPGYAKDAPNRCMQGFEYGWVESNGIFHYQVVQIVNGTFRAEGKVYKV